MRIRIYGWCLFWLSLPAHAVDLQATLDWSQRVELGTAVSGVVTEVPVQAGQRVEKDNLLLQLDDQNFKAQVSKTESEYKQAKVHLDEARREEERSNELYERTLLSDHDRQMVEIARIDAEAALKSAMAANVHARENLSLSSVRAPFSGLVVKVSAAPGNVIVSNFQSASLIVLASDQPMQALAEVDQRLVSRLAKGQQVKVAVRNSWLEGEIALLGLEPVRNTDQGPLYQLQVAFSPPADMQLRAGESVIVRVDEP